MGSCPDTDIDPTYAGYDLFPLFTCFFVLFCFFSLSSLLFFLVSRSYF